MMEKVRACGVARGVESSDVPDIPEAPVAARWRGVEGAHSWFSMRWTGRLRERMDCVGWWVDCERSRCCDGIGGKAVGIGSSISSIGVGAALVPMVVQLKCDMSGGLPVLVVDVFDDDCLLVISERAAVDKLNLFRGLESGTVRRVCGGWFWRVSVAGGDGDITGLRLN